VRAQCPSTLAEPGRENRGGADEQRQVMPIRRTAMTVLYAAGASHAGIAGLNDAKISKKLATLR
jgi:hypothetical protein